MLSGPSNVNNVNVNTPVSAVQHNTNRLVTFGLINSRSVSNKAHILNETISNRNIGVLLVLLNCGRS